MKRILLIKLPEPSATNQKRCVMPPIGLWSIRTNITKQIDAEVDICDMHIGDNLDTFLQMHYDIIGISAQFSIQHDLYLQITQRAKATGSTVVAGGYHAAAVEKPEYVDFIAKGWGERWFASYFGYDNPGEIFHPEFSLSEISRYWDIGLPHDLKNRSSRWISFETSRGCDRNCGFCAGRKIWGRWSGFSFAWIARYLNYLAEKGIQELFIEDDNLTAKPYRFELLIKLFQKYGMKWSTPNGIEAQILWLIMPNLQNTGCWRLSLPFETGVKETAKKMRLGDKWLNPEKARDLVDSLNRQGIETCGFFIIGWPGETLKQMQQTLDFANSLPLHDRHIYIATPYPGTQLYEDCKKHGYLTVDGPELYRELLYSRCVIRTPDWDPEQVEELRQRDRETAIARQERKPDPRIYAMMVDEVIGKRNSELH